MENDTFGGAILAWVKMKLSACDTCRRKCKKPGFSPHSLHEIRGTSPYRRGCRQRHRELSQSSWGV